MGSKTIVGLFLITGWAWSQTGINGEAIVTLIDEGITCNGYARSMSIAIDVTGLTGSHGDPAGLNGYVLRLTTDRSNVFAYATPGKIPDVGWHLMTTHRETVTTEFTLVGWSDDTQAPNDRYRVATLWFSGTMGPVSVDLVPAESSLGSRVVNGDGPGPISISSGPIQISIDIPQTFNLSFQEGASHWLSAHSQFEFVPPLDSVDVRDLAQLINCGG